MNKKIKTVIEITASHIKFMQSKLVRGKRTILASENIPIRIGSDQEVIDIAASLLIIAAIFQLSDGTQAVGIGILRGLAERMQAS